MGFRQLTLLMLTVLGVPFSETQVAAQSRASVAIYRLDDTTGSGLSGSLTTMLETAISTTGKLMVVERSKLRNLVTEKQAIRSGIIRGNPNTPLGRFAGADYLIYGTITSLNVNEDTMGLVGGLATVFFKSGKGTGCTATMNLEVDIKITDAESGEIRYTSRVSQRESVPTDCGTDLKNTDYSPVVRKVARKVALELVTTIYPMQVANATGDGFIMINYGSEAFALNDSVNIYKKGDGFRDPATGEILGSDDVLLAKAIIVETNQKFSKAKIAGKKNVSIPVGSIVRKQVSQSGRKTD